MEDDQSGKTPKFDLFPKISRFATLPPPQNDIELDDQYIIQDDLTSITTGVIKHKLHSIDPGDWDNRNNDKFYYSKMFGKSDLNDEQDLSDFAKYDLMVNRETQIAKKTQKVINSLRNGNITVDVDLENQFDPGNEISFGEKRYNNFSFKHHLNLNKGGKEAEVKLYSIPSGSSNRTQIIDVAKEDLTEFDAQPDYNSQNNKYHLQRKLAKPQIQMIALGGTLGVGLFLNSGKAFSIGGPLGCFLGFFISGSIVLATMLSFAEMSTLIPTTSSISGLASRFVEDAFGFALGWCYFISFAIAMPSEVCAGTIMLSYYQYLNVPSASTAGFISLFLCAIVSVNLFDVRFYGNIEYGVSFFKVIVCAVLICTMLAINIQQHYGFLYWNPATSTEWETHGPFRPTFDLNDVGTGALNGIGGALGRLLGTISSVLISSYAYTGSEIGFVASMECKNPRKALPSVTKRVFGRIVILYLLSIFLVGLNMYSGDPRLLRYYQPTRAKAEIPQAYIEAIETTCPSNFDLNQTNGNQSPWTIALQSAGYCTFSNVLDSIFVVFAVSAGSAHLYVSSRTLYSMATQKKAPSIFTKCTKSGVPYLSVLFSASFGLLAYLSVSDSAMTVFQDFVNISAATAMLMWAGMCLSFLRFYYGLKLRPDIISRDDSSYPYRSPLQPFLAIYGLFGSMLIVLLMGFVVFLKGYWDTKTFFTSYGALIMFVICYAGYKIFRSSKIHRLDQLDLDSGRREIDRIIWEEDQYYISSIKEMFKKVIGWLA